MAYWQERRGKVYVYQYNRTKSKPEALPREETSHLDAQSDVERNRWVRQWEVDNKIVQRTWGKRGVVHITTEMTKLLDEYYTERAKEDGVGALTLDNERTNFNKYVLKFFVEIHGRNDFSRWEAIAGRFRPWLTETTELRPKTKKGIILAFNRFGRYLKSINKIRSAWVLLPPKLGNRRIERATPLPKAVSPKEVLQAARSIRALANEKNNYDAWALVLLAGYFCSLRPEESLALTKRDFLTGQAAVDESHTYERLAKVGLGSRMAIHVNKALITGTRLGPPKNPNSNGVVTVWSVEGARAIAEILRDWPKAKPFFSFTKGYLFKIYKREIQKFLGVTMHDLRRSSALYLGRVKLLEPFLLQEMMRHVDLETTMLYTRKPKADISKTSGLQDFDDVG